MSARWLPSLTSGNLDRPPAGPPRATRLAVVGAWALALGVVSSPEPAGAGELIPADPSDRKAARFALNGEYRLDFTAASDFEVDAEGTSFGQGTVLDQRLRLGGDLRLGNFRVIAEGDLFSGQLAGDTWDLPVTLDERRRDTLLADSQDAYVLRKLSMGTTWKFVSVEAGLVQSRWGLGMVANDGAQDPVFGRNDFGDRVVRLRVTGRPGAAREGAKDPDALSVTLAGDWVYADDLARFDRGQLAFQVVGSLLWMRPNVDAAGIYVVGRKQAEADRDRHTRLTVVDVWLDRTLAAEAWPVTLRVAAEGALVAGSTDRSLTYNARDELKVLSGGVVGLARVESRSGKVAGLLRAGWASGDGNGDDETSNDFTFDRDYDVGSVLFDTVMAGIEAGTYTLLTDPQYAGDPPDGADAVLTEGAFRRAGFVQGVLELKPVHWLRARLGVLSASASADFSQPFYTARAGGDARNQANAAPGSRHLGTEIDWSVLIGGELAKAPRVAPRFELLAEGGHLKVGKALQGEGMPSVVHQVMVQGRVRF